MKLKLSTFLIAFLLLALGATAHGDKKHVIGTIQKLDSGLIIVKTRDGKSVEVKLVASTAYVKRVDAVDKPATLADLAVGENVVVHATPKGDALEADQVRFSTGDTAHPAAPKSQP